MIDIHAHILPDLDDGPKTWQETLDMCAIAENDGIRTIVATPHVKRGMYAPGRELIISRVAELNTRLLVPRPSFLEPRSSSLAWSTEHGAPCTLHPVLTILPGADNSFEPDILDQLQNGTALTIGADSSFRETLPGKEEGTRNEDQNLRIEPRPSNLVPRTSFPEPRSSAVRYILLELTDYFLFPQVKDLIRKLREINIVPVLSHPERIAMIQRNYKLLHEFIQAGALSQITAMSVTGEFGKEIKKLTRTLIKKNLAHVIATDAHSREHRPPILSRAVSEAADLIGSARAELMVKGIPRAIIDGREITIS